MACSICDLLGGMHHDLLCIELTKTHRQIEAWEVYHSQTHAKEVHVSGEGTMVIFGESKEHSSQTCMLPQLGKLSLIG